MSSVACLDMVIAGERPGTGILLAASQSGTLLTSYPVIRAKAFFDNNRADKNYIAVEHYKPREACATIWPIIEPEQVSPLRHTRRWKYSLAGCCISAGLHISAIALASGLFAATADMPAGSEVLLDIEVLDEAAFAALEEGTVRGRDVSQIDVLVPDLAEPVDMQKALTEEQTIAVVSAIDPDISMPDVAAPPDAALLLPLHNQPQPKPKETLPPLETDRRVEAKQVRQKQRKSLTKGSELAANAPGKQGTGRNIVSTASVTPGRAKQKEGMAGAGAEANWRSKIIAHLARHKRYPQAADPLRLEGSVRVSFTIDGNGFLKSATVDSSSGHPLLDRDALAMLRRAQPFPVPPEEAGGQGITITTQVGYNYPR